MPRAQPGNETLPYFRSPAFDNLFALGGGNVLGTLAPLDVVPLVNVKKLREGFDTGVSNWTLGPVNRNARIRSLGRLNTVESVVPVLPLKPQIPKPDAGVLCARRTFLPI